jgi:predicted nucleic acid-binding protein
MAATAAVVPAYFDSALVAKFYLNEPGREEVRRLATNMGLVVTSGIAVAEVSAAFHRKFREGAVDRTAFKALQGQFEHDLDQGLWKVVGPTEALLQQVQALFLRLDKSVFLRSLDAVHLVTAKAEHFDRIYSNDKHLLGACASVALTGIDPTRPCRTAPDAARSSLVRIGDEIVRGKRGVTADTALRLRAFSATSAEL